MNSYTVNEVEVSLSPLGSGNEKIITAERGESVLDLDQSQVKEWIQTYGAILLRGFSANDKAFSDFIHRSSQRVTVDPARIFVSTNSQLVDAGTMKVGLHCENGNAPILPHVIWFYCSKAAKTGSQSTICDGERVWKSLPENIQQAFLAQRIMYTRNLPKNLWQKYVFHEVGGFESPDDVTVDDLMKLAEGVDGQTFIEQEDGVVFSEFRVPAAHSTLFSDNIAFANSLLGPSYNYETPLITFEDGSEISKEIWDVIADVTAVCTEDIPWQDGDIAIIDNTRYMHGRREIEDDNRRICAALSYL